MEGVEKAYVGAHERRDKTIHSDIKKCQINKAKYRPRGNKMVVSKHSTVPFEVVHLDFAQLQKKKEGIKKTVISHCY